MNPKLEWRSPDSLTPYYRNSKAHPTHQIDRIAASIAEFGFDQPIVIDEQGVILKGHGRREAALRLNLEQVPVIVQANLTEAQKKGCRIADNKVAESEWLDKELCLELLDLQAQDYDLGLIGFNDEELSQILAEEDLEDPFDSFADQANDGTAEKERSDAVCTIGQYRFTISREQYDQWQEQMRQTIGFDEDSIIAEILRRLAV